MCSIWNLVMHFHKIAYIPWFLDTELWELLGVGPHNFRRGCFSYVPEPNYTNFQQKIAMKSFKNDFLNSYVQVSYRIWVLGSMTGWIFISQIFNDNSRNLAYFLRPYTLSNSIYIKFKFNFSKVSWKPLYMWLFLWNFFKMAQTWPKVQFSSFGLQLLFVSGYGHHYLNL